MSYRKLKPELIVDTARRLAARIDERFAGFSLGRVCKELLAVAEKAAVTSEWIDRPNIWLRCGVGFCILLVLAAGVAAVASLKMQYGNASIFEALQGIEAGINDVVFLAIAIFFLLTWENRIKRNRALKAIHELRSLAHIIDMHQLTKDPERIMNQGESTPSSPERKMTTFELIRYLDYCSEMLAIISKIAAVYVQNYDDDVTLAAVDEVSTLTTGLSGKIWQKIMILDRISRSTP